MKVLGFVLATVILNVPSARPDDAVARERALATDMVIRPSETPIRISATAAGDAGSAVAPLGVSPTTGIALRIRVVKRSARPFVVVVGPRSGSGTRHEYSSVDGRAKADEFWTHEIPGYHALVEVRPTPGDTNEPAVEVIAYGRVVVRATQERLCGARDDVEAAAVPSAYRAWLKPVARLELFTGSNRAHCSAFLVGRDVLMTNHHCALSEVIPGAIVARLGYDRSGDPKQDFAVVKRLGFDAHLDYALLRIEPAAPPGFGRLHLSAADTPPPVNLLLAGHPDGTTKRASIAQCRREGAPAQNFFGHHCDTAGGSSGSPVMDRAAGVVVGLHHVGVIGCGKHGLANEAVSAARIVASLRKQGNDGTIEQAVVDEVLQ